VSLLVGTCDASARPDCVRAVGVRVRADACGLTVLVPSATGATSVANVRANPRIAVTLSEVPTHRTFQVKGRVLAVRDGDADDHALARRYRASFVETLAYVGQLPRLAGRIRVWPCHAIDLEIEVVFAQTPGPVAGERMPLREKA
jgi:hypothetical protein